MKTLSTSIGSRRDAGSQELEIRQATTSFEIDQLRQALNQEHPLKAGRPAGKTIWQGIYKTTGDEDFPVLCSVLCRSGAALRLKDRDEWIGWDPLTRGSRLPLVTQLRRFLVLESRRKPNLATRCMGLALRALPGHFEEKYGYRPSHPLDEALTYALGQWTRFENYLENGLPEIDSNFVENAVRPTKLGMKNWLCVSRKEEYDKLA